MLRHSGWEAEMVLRLGDVLGESFVCGVDEEGSLSKETRSAPR